MESTFVYPICWSLSAASAERNPPPQYKTIERCSIGHLLLDVAFDDSLAEMDGVRQVIFVPLVVFAHIDEKKVLLSVELCLHIFERNFTDTFLGVVHDFRNRGECWCAMLE